MMNIIIIYVEICDETPTITNDEIGDIIEVIIN